MPEQSTLSLNTKEEIYLGLKMTVYSTELLKQFHMVAKEYRKQKITRVTMNIAVTLLGIWSPTSKTLLPLPSFSLVPNALICQIV